MNPHHRLVKTNVCIARFVVVACVVCSCAASGYTAPIHQQVTFIAALHFNRCIRNTAVPRMTPLEIRYMAQGNTKRANRSLWQKIKNGNYYDYDSEDGESHRIFWYFETRFHREFNELTERLENLISNKNRYSDLGSISNVLQDVTSPVHVVPIRMNRFWRIPYYDRFNRFSLNESIIEDALADCNELIPHFELEEIPTFQVLLDQTAKKTIDAIRTPIAGYPVSWEVFWTFGSRGSFGHYGVAGNNFGHRTQFQCEAEQQQRCILLFNDPLYKEFAFRRHIQAIKSTVTAMLRVQVSKRAQMSRAARQRSVH